MAMNAAPRERMSSMNAWKTRRKTTDRTSNVTWKKISETVAVTVSKAAASACMPSRSGARPICASSVSAPASDSRRAVSVLIVSVAFPVIVLALRVVPIARA